MTRNAQSNPGEVMEGAPLKRAIAALMSTALLAVFGPTAASAAAPTKYAEQRVLFECQSGVGNGFVSFFVDSSSQFGTFSELAFWEDPAVPFEEPPTVDGQTETVDITQGTSSV